ncbi:hypothetical protein [Sulfitobacter sp. PM12]|uniref:hypothetical protein n=1 Tax=Sulfitobacter sp. PM12 TaxID=3138497 RepID=UPI003890C246
MNNGTDIAAEVLAGLAEAGEATGNGPMVCTLRRVTGGSSDPWGEIEGDKAYHEVTAVQTQKQNRDDTGTLVGVTKTMLMIDATGVAPLKSDHIATNLRKADVTGDTRFHEIADVETVAPAGVALMHKVWLAD